MLENNVKITQITDNNQHDSSPVISGNNIAWQGDSEIFFYDGNTVTQVTDKDFDGVGVSSISGYSVAWTGSDGNDREIFIADIFYDDPLFRFQNTEKPGTYLFVDTEESESIRANYPQFAEEGFAFDIPSETEDNLLRFNRFRNTEHGGYLFASEEESISIRENFSDVFIEEGIAFYTYGADAGQGVDIFRFHNTEIPGNYIFVGEAERQNILANNPQFVEEGIAFEAIV